MRNLILRGSLVAACSLALAACGGGSSSKRQAYDDGGKERITILTSTSDLRADPSLVGQNVLVPAPYKNGVWTQAGGNTAHAVQHLALGNSLSLAWRADVGDGDRSYERMTTGPVSAEGKVFAMDVEGRITAVNLATGRLVWQQEAEGITDRSDVGFGGGVAYGNGLVVATLGYGYVAAYAADTGKQVWRYDALVPLRGAPTVADGRVFALTQDNQTIALSLDDGEYLWDQVGIAESAGMLGAASPAYDGTALVVALSSGELTALLATNGQVLWQDTLASSRRLTPLATLADIDGAPVVAGGRVYAVSHAGSLVAIDMRTGERSWEADIASVNTPWIAGRFAYVVTIDGEVACISLSDGRTKWVTQLQRFTNQQKRTGLVKWNGPVLAGDRLVVTSSHGYALSVSPYTGEVISGITLPAGTSLPSIVVDETLIIQTEKGELLAYR